MVRKFVCILSAILLQVTVSFCSAQNDDFISAKWKEGQMREFRMEGTAFDVSEKGDTTYTSRGSYDFSVEVLKASDSGYEMRLNYPTSIYTSNMDINLSDIGDSIPIEFKTDEFGIFDRVTNTSFLAKLSERLIEAAIKLPQLSSMDESDLRAMLKSYMSPERMVQSFSQDIDVLFWVFGVAVKKGEKLTYESEADMGNGMSIPTTTSILLEPDEEDKSLYIVDMVTDYDSKSLGPVLAQFLRQMMENVKDKGKYDQKEFEGFMSKSQMNLADYYQSAVDVNTTWPLMSGYIREISIETPDGVQQKIQKRVIYSLDD